MIFKTDPAGLDDARDGPEELRVRGVLLDGLPRVVLIAPTDLARQDKFNDFTNYICKIFIENKGIQRQ